MSSTREPRIVTLGLVQMSCSENKQDNVDKAVQRIGEASARGAQVVCLQELFHSSYPCQSEEHRNFAEAEPIPGPITSALSEAAKRHGVVVVGSMFERRAAGLYHNTAVVLD